MSEDGCVCRLRGLPWSATPDEVIEFFGDAVHIVPEGVAFTYSREGRPSGEAFVELESEEDVEAALTMHKKHMGQRYIEVFRSKQSEMEWVVKRAGKNQNSQGEAIVRLRGLPFGCSKEEIAQFFSGLEIVPNGIMLPEDRQGRGTGEAYVQFSSSEIAERALLKHKERIGHRYIEIFKSSLDEASAFMTPPSRPRPLMGNMGPTRPTPYARDNRGFMGGSMGGMGMSGGGGGGGGAGGSMYGRGRGGRNLKGYYDDDFDDGMGMGGGGMRSGGGSMGMGRRGGNMRQQQRGLGGASSMGGGGGGFGGMGGGSRFSMQHSVHMRGLPFQANQRDIQDFFAPLDPKGVELKYNDQGRPTGEADVEFMSHQDAVEAMKKHKANMQHRYIELFLNSTPGGRGHGDGFGGDDFDGDGDMGMMDMNSRGMRRGILSLFSPKVKFDPACKGQPPSLLGGGDGMGGGYGGGNMGMDGGGFGGMGKNPNYTAF